MVHKYIEKIDSEIANLIKSESETATTSGERDLHYLFENRKHVLKWDEERGTDARTAMADNKPFGNK